MAGRPPTYHANEERPVSVSLRIPQPLYVQAQQYASQRRMSMTELLLDGLTLRLETPTDPRERLFLSDERLTVMQALKEELKGALLDDVRHEVHAMLTSAAQVDHSPRSTLPPTALPHDNCNTVIQEEATKQCRYSHAPYPASKKECPACVNARQQRKRDRAKAREEFD
jgi:hypothetical protein